MRSGRACVRLVVMGAAWAAAALIIVGCGNSYRPVVTPVTPSGPASEITAYALVVSAPTTTTGIATVIDWSGDSVMAYAPITSSPLNLVLDEIGTNAYTVNRNGTLTNFTVSTSLQAKSITYTTLSSSAQVANMLAPSTGMWATDIANNTVDIFSGIPATLKTSVSVATSPVMLAGAPAASGERQYAIAQNFTDSTGVACNTSPTTQAAGVAVPIEVSTSTADTPIALGVCPVFAVQTPDLRRLFVLNRGDDTISVINTATNALDSCTPYKNLSGQWVTCHSTIQLPTGSGPVFAEYNSTKQQLVVSNYDGGTISVIDVPLDQWGNDANSYTNSNCTTYADCGAITSGFGTIHTIKVGTTSKPYPASVTVLYDGSRAYSANQGDDDGSGNGTVSVVNLSSYTVEKTLSVVGHPRTVVSTQNSTYAKIYAASPDSPYLTVIKDTGTSSDTVGTTILIQGNIVDVRVTAQGGTSSTNSYYVSRTPGYGQPCSLPPSLLSNSSLTLDLCRQIP